MRMEKEEQMSMDMQARLIKESVNVSSDPSFKYFDRYADIGTLRIFALPEVSDDYLVKVGSIYKLIFDEDNSKIDRNLKNEFFQTIKNDYVYQRVGYKDGDFYDLGSENSKIDHPGNNYEDNQTDFIWEPEGSDDPTGEIIEHALHTITNVAFRLMSSDWDYENSSSKIRLAYDEAVNNGMFNEDIYKGIPSEDFMKIATQEYFFWVIITEWELGFLWDLPNEEFLIKNKEELAEKLPASHQLYQDFVIKILTPLDIDMVKSIIN